MSQLKKAERRIEAILFASGEPIKAAKLAQIVGAEEEVVQKLVNKLIDRYIKEESAIDILLLDGAYQMSTRPEYADDIRAALEMGKGSVLSSAALEVLAVVAYNEPVTRAFIEEVRGVDCSYIIKGLIEKKLVEEAGRLNVPGKPIVYRTTDIFLRSFGLESLEKLPILSEEDINQDDEEQIEGQIDFFDQNE